MFQKTVWIKLISELKRLEWSLKLEFQLRNNNSSHHKCENYVEINRKPVYTNPTCDIIA